MVAHFCQSEKKEREKEKKIKKKKNRKRFFSQKAKQNKAVHKNEIKLKKCILAHCCQNDTFDPFFNKGYFDPSQI